MSSQRYRNSHCGYKAVVSSSYLHRGNSYIGKAAFYIEWAPRSMTWMLIYMHYRKSWYDLTGQSTDRVTRYSGWKKSLQTRSVGHRRCYMHVMPWLCASEKKTTTTFNHSRCWNWNILGEISQYYGSWCSGSVRRQVISSHGMVSLRRSCRKRGRI